MTKNIKKSKEFVEKSITKRYVSILGGISALLVIVYVSIVGQTVFATVARKSAVVEAKEKMNEVALLEVEYISKSKALTKEKAYELGLKDIKEVSYAKDGGEFTFDSKKEHAF
jgi:hypothetical protein